MTAPEGRLGIDGDDRIGGEDRGIGAGDEHDLSPFVTAEPIPDTDVRRDQLGAVRDRGRFAGIWARDAADNIAITGTGIANKVQITTFDTNGPSNGLVPDHTNSHILIDVAGAYGVKVSIHADSTAGTSAKYGFSVWVNNGATEKPGIHAHRDMAAGGGDTGSITLSGIENFAVGDTVEVWVWNETNTQNIVIDDINLAVSIKGIPRAAA